MDKDKNNKKIVEEKFNAFLSDIAKDLLDKDDLDAIGKIVRMRLTKNGCTPGLPGIKAFFQGFEFGVYCSQNDKEVPALVGIRAIIGEEEAKVQERVDKSMGEKNV